MTTLSLLEPSAKQRVAALVTELEQQTSAEIVVRVSLGSGDYRAADTKAGLAALSIALLVFLFHPEPFDTRYFPVVAALTYLFGATVCRLFEPLRRALTPRLEREHKVSVAAKAAFYDDGVAQTKKRLGLLVYVSAFERKVRLVPDGGFPKTALGAPLERAEKRLDRALEAGLSVDDFERALRDLGKLLAEVVPRQADDENELPDEVRS